MLLHEGERSWRAYRISDRRPCCQMEHDVSQDTIDVSIERLKACLYDIASRL